MSDGSRSIYPLQSQTLTNATFGLVKNQTKKGVVTD